MRAWIWLTVAGLLVTLMAFLARMFFNESGRRRLLPILRPLLKHVINPATLRAVERGASSYGIVHHRGRRSGTPYETPVDALRTSTGVLITLPYGSGTDWCRNVLAEGGCQLVLDGEELTLTAPQVVPTSIVEAQVSADVARRWQRQGLVHFLALRAASLDAPNGAQAPN